MVAGEVGEHPGVLLIGGNAVSEACALHLIFVIDAHRILLCLYTLLVLGGGLVDPLALIGFAVCAQGGEGVIGLLVLVHNTGEEVPVIEPIIEPKVGLITHQRQSCFHLKYL